MLTAALSLASVLIAGVSAIPLAQQPTSLDAQIVDILNEADAVENIFSYLKSFEEIAMRPENHGSRSVVNGYNASAEWVYEQLTEKTDLIVSKHYFDLPIYEEYELPSLTFPEANPALNLRVCNQFTGWQRYEGGCDYAGMRYGGNGTFDITEEWIDVGDGCEDSDFEGFPAGKLALIIGGGACDYYAKGLRAEKLGASGVIFYNYEGTTTFPGSRVRATGWMSSDPIVQIPSIGLTYSTGMTLKQSPTLKKVRLQTKTAVLMVTSLNILAETGTGDLANTVMVGAHLDSVPEGPGIDDNGSGSATVLEIALRFASYLQANAKYNVRFAWWGAEEVGLLGSYAYVDTLKKTRKTDDVMCYFNYDMLGASNFVRFVHNAEDAPEIAREGSRTMQSLLISSFDRLGYPFALTGMTGGSDFLPFLNVGIPTGGLLTGATGIKTDEERHTFGGFSNTQQDPCYHAPCDTVDNINPEVLSTDYVAASESMLRVAMGLTEVKRNHQ